MVLLMYVCADCDRDFGVEPNEYDERSIVCPLCISDESLRFVGYANVAISLAEPERD